MLRLRFTSGLMLGLLLGVPAGTLIGLLLFPTHPGDQNVSTSLQIEELTRQLDVAKEQKEHVDRQLEQFAKLADQMTASFNALELRFTALQEAEAPRAEPHEAPPATRGPTPEAPGAAAQGPAVPAPPPQAERVPNAQPPAGHGSADPAGAEPPPVPQ